MAADVLLFKQPLNLFFPAAGAWSGPGKSHLSGPFFIALLNPAVGLLLTAAFTLLWLHQRHRTYVAVAAGGYAASVAGFVIQDVIPHPDAVLARFGANFCFLAAAALLAVALISRYRVPVPYLPLGLIVLAGMGGFAWYFFVDPDLTNRIYAVSFALGAIALLVAAQLAVVRKPYFVDRLLFAVCLVAAANFILRPVLIFWLAGRYESYDGFQQSVYWTTVQVSQAVIAIMIALTLMVAVALDLVAELKAESEVDRLSGVLNRRGFEDRAAQALAEPAFRGRPMAMATADIDHFKRINDSYGHAAGDEVIAAFGRLLRSSATEGAVIGRLGGEEFAVLVPGADIAAARLFAEGVRVALGATRLAALPGDAAVTVSFGVCEKMPGDGLADLLRRADKALYAAKHAGRDRVHVFASAPRPVPAAEPGPPAARRFGAA